MPLLVGLLDSTHIRRSEDGGILLTRNGQSGEELDEELEGVIAKGKHGGGMFDSIANMANSILGAGQYVFTSPRSICSRNTQGLSVGSAECFPNLNSI